MSRMTLLQFAALVLLFLQGFASSTGSEGSNGTSALDLNGQVLIDMGIKLNKPLMQLLGRTIQNVEDKANQRTCDLHPCTEWTTWSGCHAKLNNFGAKERTRTCGRNPTTCLFDSRNRTEEDSQICIGVCTDNYNLTKNGYCVKLYKNVTVSQSVAEQQCVADGGHLITIDSERKNEDVIQFLLTESFVGLGFWIDGQRKDANSPWEYRYGSSDSYIKWKSGYPKNSSNFLCLMTAIGSGKLEWYDQPCSSGYRYICEIV